MAYSSPDQFVEALSSLLTERDPTSLQELSARLQPYRVEVRHVTIGSKTFCSPILALEKKSAVVSE